jgi:putative flippase GtrA
MFKQKANKKRLRVQIFQYLVSGGAFFWSGYLAFAIFDSVFHFPLFIAKQLANIIGISVNYVLEDQWVFQKHVSDKRRKKRRLKRPQDIEIERRKTSRYILITVLNFLIDYLIVLGLKDVGISPYIGQFASAGFFTVWNFLWYKYFVFAHTPSQKKGKRTLKRKGKK